MEIVRKLLDVYVTSAAKGRRPLSASLEPTELGRRLANKFLSAEASRSDRSDPESDAADEGSAMLLFMLSRLAESPLEIDVTVGRLSIQRELGDYFLYVPHTFVAQFVRVMSECTVHQWIRASSESWHSDTFSGCIGWPKARRSPGKDSRSANRLGAGPA